MNIQEYLEQCSVKSVDELTEEQVVNYYKWPDIYIGQKCAVLSAIRDCSYKGRKQESDHGICTKSFEDRSRFQTLLRR